MVCLRMHTQVLADTKHGRKACEIDMHSQATERKEGEIMGTKRFRVGTEAANICE